MRLLLAALLCVLAAAPAAEGWTIEGDRWPGPTITVWNATGYPVALRDAMHAWNAAGAKIRFEAAPGRADADVVVRYGALREQGRANVGYEPDGTTVWIVRGLERTRATTIAAHELGHVLGLGHESRGCALMAPVVNAGQSSRCGLAACRVLWRCLVQPDDVKGLRLLYGRLPPA